MSLQAHEKHDASEEIGCNPSAGESFAAIADRRLSRRGVMGGLLAAGTVAALSGGEAAAQAGFGPSTLTFPELPHGYNDKHHVAAGYKVDVVVRWGDPILPGAPAFDPNKLTVAGQEKQFGYNADFIGYFPLPMGGKASNRGVLCVNNEYVNPNLMWAGLGTDADRAGTLLNDATRHEICMAAHGMSFVEVARDAKGTWSHVATSKYNRRVSGLSTLCDITGPARGHDLLKTSTDASGTKVVGTLNNCAGGTTPWGTVLTGEENINGYFGGDPSKMPQASAYKRMGIVKESWYNWWQTHDRFNVEKEPNEPNRFGYIVEIDPYDPNSTPKKRTALGRFKHEGAETILNKDGKLVVYMGDDERFEYVYKFVSRDAVDLKDRAKNADLLDHGTLYVAKFNDDGSVAWMPLVHGQGPLTAENGFPSQAEICIETRRAADLLGATKMDRPEDVQPNPKTGRVYVALTNNSRRTAEGGTAVNKANPRPANNHGHIVEIIPAGGVGAEADHAATTAKWEIFLLAGKPGQDSGARYHRLTSDNGWLSCPDNVAFDSKGRIIIATDGAPTAAGIADSIYIADTEGAGRALTRHFFSAPLGAEICGPCLTPDDKTLFLAIQHPGEAKGSSFETPNTRWPDFKPGMPPRPAVIAITKIDGGDIGA